MSKEQRLFYNDGVCGHVHNLLFRYRTETTKQTVMRIVRTQEEISDIEAYTLQHNQAIYNMADD